jgi:hypothetical protein
MLLEKDMPGKILMMYRIKRESNHLLLLWEEACCGVTTDAWFHLGLERVVLVCWLRVVCSQ